MNQTFAFDNGDVFTYKNNKLHSFDGKPAIKLNDTSIWFNEGKLHNQDGPAFIAQYASGIRKEYWLYGIQMTHDEFIEYLCFQIRSYRANEKEHSRIIAFMNESLRNKIKEIVKWKWMFKLAKKNRAMIIHSSV